MSALVHDSPDRAVTAIEPLTGSDNFATWKRLLTSYLKARQVWDVVSGDLQRPDCLFKYAKPITADIHPLVEPHLNGAVRQRAIEARLEVEVQAFERHREWSRLATTLTSPWCRLGTCECLAWEVFAELRRVTTGQHCPLARATAGARAQGSGALTPRTGDKGTL
ncbi:hypothetical protein PENFLA_c103G00256 [Penicillium flavigenum]|uniref:DUF4219 domain-containing protein n=1 Tax=Penicillium flavigenum TaxID=254877 RepID=A0A1V6S6K8_9EURO|nr:hypothetical protein PENFLA_c103G00256 [Penicillium flavigenum]